MTTSASASLASQVGDVRAGSVCVNLSPVRMEGPVLCPVAQCWDTPAPVNLATLGLTVKGACHVGSCPATMEAAVHLPHVGPGALACQVMQVPSVSTAVMKVAPPSPAATEGCAWKTLVSHSSTASVPVDGRGNGASIAAEW